MTAKPNPKSAANQRRPRAKAGLDELATAADQRPMMVEVYRRAKTQVRKQRKVWAAQSGDAKAGADNERLLQELQVHQVELEMQNTELQESRNRAEELLEQYTDLYDFSPVGYFTLDAAGVIRLVNLTGATIVAIERSRLVGRTVATLVAPEARTALKAFLHEVFASPKKQSGEFRLAAEDRGARFVNIEAQRLINGRECRAVVADITARRRVEDLMRVSETRYRRLFEAAHDGVLLLDPETRKITDANPFMTTLLGYSHEQLVGKELFEIGLLRDESASQEMFRRLKRRHEVRYEDLPLESKTGRHQEVEVVANLYQEGGHAVIQCNIRDITARKTTEHELAEKARLLDLSHDAIIVRDMEGHIRYWNDGAKELYGWSRKEALGKISNVLLKTKYPVPLEVMTEELFRTDRWIGELIHTDRAGRRITVFARKTLDRDGRGKPSSVLENITDITERKEAEEALRRNEALFSALIAQAPVGVYVVDSKFRLQQVNRTSVPIFRNVHPLIGRDFSEVIHILWPKRVAAKVVAQFRETLKTGNPYQATEFAERRRDLGTREHYEWQIQRVTLPAGEFGVVCFFNNITERKRADETQRRIELLGASNRKLEEEILQRRFVEASLKKSKRHKGMLLMQSRRMQEQLRRLSHQVLRSQEDERKRISRELHDEIAQTLVNINIHLETLAQESKVSPHLFRKKIERTRRMVEKSVDIVHQFARELRPPALDHLGLVPALHAFMHDFMKRTGIRVHFTTFAGVEALNNVRCTVLYRVVQAALGNVAQHARAGMVDVGIVKQRDRVCLTIKDDGVSFDVERALRPKAGGRLGLLGMKERLEMIGGSFGIESVAGKGTTITGWIPFSFGRVGGEAAPIRQEHLVRQTFHYETSPVELKPAKVRKTKP